MLPNINTTLLLLFGGIFACYVELLSSSYIVAGVGGLTMLAIGLNALVQTAVPKAVILPVAVAVLLFLPPLRWNLGRAYGALATTLLALTLSRAGADTMQASPLVVWPLSLTFGSLTSVLSTRVRIAREAKRSDLKLAENSIRF